jgi:agmatinase
MLKIGELSQVDRMVQVGSRGIRASIDDLCDSTSRGNEVLTMTRFRNEGIGRALAAIPAGAKVYVSVDIDVLDMPLLSGCASAEADGVSYEQLRQAIFAIVAEHELVGFDIVEINPMLDVASNNTSLLGAQLAIEVLARVVENPDYLRRKGRLQWRRMPRNSARSAPR